MTAEMPDRMVYQRRAYALLTKPLEDYFDDPRHPRPDAFAMVSTACGRGYVARWNIKRNKLYLSRIQPFVMSMNLDESVKDAYSRYFALLFGDAPAPKLADWFSGELHLGFGDLDDCFDTCYVYQNEIRLQVSRGVLVKQA